MSEKSISDALVKAVEPEPLIAAGDPKPATEPSLSGMHYLSPILKPPHHPNPHTMVGQGLLVQVIIGIVGKGT